MSTAVHKPMTVGDFLAWEDHQPLRYEFDGFQPIAMAGGEPQSMLPSNATLRSRSADGCAVSYAGSMAGT